jgi:hypothetical protein
MLTLAFVTTIAATQAEGSLSCAYVQPHLVIKISTGSLDSKQVVFVRAHVTVQYCSKTDVTVRKNQGNQRRRVTYLL